MKIVGIMAIHGRPEITTATLRMLRMGQSLPFLEIIAVGEGEIEAQCARDAGCEFLRIKNEPLGRKYQCGLAWAQVYDPDAVCVLGSDSWLSPDWLKVCADAIQAGAMVIGKSDWHSCFVKPRKKVEILHLGYRPEVRSEPVGAGRLISRAAIEAVSWNLWPLAADNNLDFLSHRRLSEHGVTSDLIWADPIQVMGIKGPWETLNRFEQIKRSTKLEHYGPVVDPASWMDTIFPGGRDAINEVVPGVIWN